MQVPRHNIDQPYKLVPRRVQKHGRHASMDTTMIYDDALSDFAGEVAKVVSEALEE
jgi:hypothetical protein